MAGKRVGIIGTGATAVQANRETDPAWDHDGSRLAEGRMENFDSLVTGADQEVDLVADGTSYEVDCIIFATGFEVGTSYTRRAGYDVIGRGGEHLSDKWNDGPRTFHGLQTNGPPTASSWATPRRR